MSIFGPEFRSFRLPLNLVNIGTTESGVAVVASWAILESTRQIVTERGERLLTGHDRFLHSQQKLNLEVQHCECCSTYESDFSVQIPACGK